MEATLPSGNQPASREPRFFRLSGVSLGIFLLMHLAFGCSGQSGSDLTPVPAVKFTLNLGEKINENLAVKGGYVVMNEVIVAQTTAGQFVAVSANCTKDNTKLVFKSADNQFYCPADLSRFDLMGKVVAGPATVPLTVYTVEANTAAGTLVVHN